VRDRDVSRSNRQLSELVDQVREAVGYHHSLKIEWRTITRPIEEKSEVTSLRDRLQEVRAQLQQSRAAFDELEAAHIEALSQLAGSAVFGSSSTEDGTEVVIEGFTVKIRKADLQSYIAPIGAVKEIRRFTEIPFSFVVVFATVQAAEKAVIELNGQTWNGARLFAHMRWTEQTELLSAVTEVSEEEESPHEEHRPTVSFHHLAEYDIDSPPSQAFRQPRTDVPPLFETAPTVPMRSPRSSKSAETPAVDSRRVSPEQRRKSMIVLRLPKSQPALQSSEVYISDSEGSSRPNGVIAFFNDDGAGSSAAGQSSLGSRLLIQLTAAEVLPVRGFVPEPSYDRSARSFGADDDYSAPLYFTGTDEPPLKRTMRADSVVSSLSAKEEQELGNTEASDLVSEDD
jgi:hypothetical protein